MNSPLLTTATAPPADKRHIPGEAGIWVLVLGDSLVFGLMFVTFLAYRSMDVAGYQAAQGQLNVHIGAINTLLLLTSSWCVASALACVRRGQDNRAAKLLGTAWLLGLGFALLKLVEYSSKIGDGITPLSNGFFMFYFVLTGVHFFHLLVGLGVLAYLLHLTRRCQPARQHLVALESGATFWHLVDLLWIVLFPLLYLVQ